MKTRRITGIIVLVLLFETAFAQMAGAKETAPVRVIESMKVEPAPYLTDTLEETVKENESEKAAGREESLQAQSDEQVWTDQKAFEEEVIRRLKETYSQDASKPFRFTYKVCSGISLSFPSYSSETTFRDKLADEGAAMPRYGDGADEIPLNLSSEYTDQTFQYSYITISNAEREAEVKATDQEALKIIESLKLNGKSDYEKVHEIYLYMSDHFKYNYDAADQIHAGNIAWNEKYTRGQTAYEALVKKTAVCAGYTRGIVRLFNEAGLDARMLHDNTGGNHAWCIVKVDGLFYNVDGLFHKFLLCDDVALDDNHIRAEKYSAPAFYQKHPMSETNYGETLQTATVTFTGTDDYEMAFQILEGINKTRKFCGAQPLVMDREWLEFAMERAEEQVVFSKAEWYGEHRPDGRGVTIPRKSLSENSAGYTFVHGGGNCAIPPMMDPEMTIAGIGVFKRDDGGYTYYMSAGSPKAKNVVTSLPNEEKTITCKIRAPYTSIGIQDIYEEREMEIGETHKYDVFSCGHSTTIPYYYDDDGDKRRAEMRYYSSKYMWPVGLFTFQSSNPSVARIDQQGNLKALKNGMTKVTVKLGSLTVGEEEVFVNAGEDPKKSNIIKDNSGNLYKITSIKKKKSTGSVEYEGFVKNSIDRTKCIVPDTVYINGINYKVTGIADKAFRNNKYLVKVTIGKNVRKIGKYAFYGCEKLTIVKIKSKVLNKVGKGAFKKIAKKSVIYIPKKKKKAYAKLLKKAYTKKLTKVKAK